MYPTQAKKRCKVPRHPLQFVSEHPLQFLVMNPPQPWEGKWETLCVFQGVKAAVFSSLVG
jgi:hypothetical protein